MGADKRRDIPMILVVEDQAESLELVSDILAGAGFRVIAAENGIDAVDSAVKLLPDVILMDLSLPLMGGLEAARLLKSDARTEEIPIVAITGHPHYERLAKEAGLDAFLSKPASPGRVLGEIEKLLGSEALAALRAPGPSSN